ncbi:MAG: OmpA family protein [Salibacteraceae bacterium]
MMRSKTGLSTVGTMLLAVILGASTFALKAQTTEEPEFKAPSWWFGGAAAANFNFYRGSTQNLNNAFTSPVAFHDGFGVGLFAGPVIEYHKADSRFGFMLAGGYDNRSGKFDQVITPCNCPADLDAKLSYISIEPSLRIAPFKNGFYLFGGPRFALNLDKSFTYQLGINPDYPEQLATPAVKGDFSNSRDEMISMQAGVGYDIPLTSKVNRTQVVISPFVALLPYFGQSPRSIETWNITTLRGGAIVKFGVGKRNNFDEQQAKAERAEKNEKATEKTVVAEDAESDESSTAAAAVIASSGKSKVDFSVTSPEYVPSQREVKEFFPLANYVFFDLGSTEIPKRYKQLNKAEVAEFREDRIDLFTPEDLSGSSVRQMTVYYNVLNILGIRMKKYPNATLHFVGSSDKGISDAKAMAESVKDYIVTMFEVDPTRITTAGQIQPTIPSEQLGGTEELVRLREEDRRVSIESSSPEMLLKYQTDPNSRLSAVEIKESLQAPIESYVGFEADGSDAEFTSWSLELSDEQGKVRTYGPFETESVAIAGKVILGNRPEGKFKATMIGTPKRNSPEVIREDEFNLIQWTPTKTDVSNKYSVIYNFNETNAILMYDNYIREEIVPNIPKNGTVIIHGHTDDIGDFKNNQRLSLARANNVKNTIQRELTARGRTDVSFKTFGFGENSNTTLFENKYPEGRLYNRSVVIEVVPPKK